MRILHTADWHLAARMGDKLTPSGINRREADIALTFARLIDRAIALEPDVFVAAGDLFDRVNPGNPAILHAYLQLQRLREGLPSTPIVLISGNHESPKEAGQGTLLPLFSTIPNVHVVDRNITHLRLGNLGVSCVPEAPGVRCGRLSPDGSARYNIALIHGEIEGMPRRGPRRDDEISQSEINIDRWDYVALGHYHVAHEIAPRCWYSGSIDYTSSDIWGEVRTGIPKGFIVRCLEGDTQEFHPLPPARPVMDLPEIDALGLTHEEVFARLETSVEGAGIDDAIVRQVVVNAPRGTRREIKREREWRKRALVFRLVIEEQPVERMLSTALHDSNLTRETLSQLVTRKLGERELPAGLPQSEFLALGAAYMEQAATKLGEQIASEPTSIAPEVVRSEVAVLPGVIYQRALTARVEQERSEKRKTRRAMWRSR